MRGILMGALIALAPGQAAAATSDTQVWTTASATGQLAPGVLGAVEVLGRYTDHASRLGQHETRLQLGTPVAKNVTLWLGFVHFSTFSREARTTYEKQSVQQVNWTVGRIGRVTLSSRTRIEQRFLRGSGAVGWRTREQMRLAVPLGKPRGRIPASPVAVLWVEPFISLNRTSAVRPGIDQMRSFAGLSIPLHKQADVEVGYLNQYLNRAGGDRSNNTLSVAVALRF